MSKNASAVKSGLNAAAALTRPQAALLFAPFARLDRVALAVSGGPDSLALMYLMARWRAARKSGPQLYAFTVDHGLRREAKAEARRVKALAAQWGIIHRTLLWRGPHPATGLQAAAREARYRLMIGAARRAGIAHLIVAHTRDDQAETVLMRMARGSGVSGLAGMSGETMREGMAIARPLLEVPRACLVATLRKAGIDAAQDPSNSDPRFTRIRLRQLMPQLEQEGLDAVTLMRLSRRLRRADAALAAATRQAASDIANDRGVLAVPLKAFTQLSEEVGLRLLGHMIAQAGHEGPVELGKLENLDAALRVAIVAAPSGFARTLAGAQVRLTPRFIQVKPAPRRRTGG